MVYLTIMLNKENCRLFMHPSPTDSLPDEIWRSDPLLPLIDLDRHGSIQSVYFNVDQCSLLLDETVYWRMINPLDQLPGPKEQSPPPPLRTLKTLTVKSGKLDRHKAAFLATFLSGITRICSLIQLRELFISAEVNIECLPFAKKMEFYDWCTFEAGSCFFKRPSSPSPHRNYMIGKDLFDLELSFSRCRMPDELDVSFLQDFPRIALNVYCPEGFPVALLNILCLHLVKVVVHIEIHSLNMLEQCITSCCTLLEQNTILTKLYWIFSLPLSVTDVRMNKKQQERLFEAAGNARSLALHSLELYCCPEEDDVPPPITKNDILKYRLTWSRMTENFTWIGCSEKDIGWMKNRIRSDRYRLGLLLYAPFALTYPADHPLMALNGDVIRTLIESFLPIGDKVVDDR